MKRILEIIVAHNPSTIEQILRKQAGLTKKQISRAKFQENGIQKNGKRCRVNDSVNQGDRIEVVIEGKEEISAHLVGEWLSPLEILYEDDDLLAVNKPAGVVTHPQGGHYQDTLANQVTAYFRKRKEEHSVRPIGRLDRETSGIVIFAKNKIAAARLQQQREKGLFAKTYLAVVHGNMPEDHQWHKIEKNMKPNTENRLKMMISKDGKEAITNYMVLESNDKYSLVKLTLETGRTHQIRVHMDSLGHPLVGDLLYGQKEGKDTRALLHAWQMELLQPFSMEPIQIEAKIPKDMSLMIRNMS